MDQSSEPKPITSLGMVTDQRGDFFFQVPAVRVHPAVLQTLDLPTLTLVQVSRLTGSNVAAAWAIADERGDWDACPFPWHSAVQLSAATWRDLGTRPRQGEQVEIAFPTYHLPVRPARTARLLDGDEIGLHRDDAWALGLEKWAFVNYAGVPGAFRVDVSDDPRDRGVARLSFRARLLLGIPGHGDFLLPDLLVAPFPSSVSGRPITVGEPHWESRPGHRSYALARRPSELLERLARLLLRAPVATLQTIEAMPGEDQALTVRMPSGLFPLLGTTPGQQVYLSWGPGNRALATALEVEQSDRSHGPPRSFRTAA